MSFDMGTFLSALLSAVAAITVCVINSRAQNKKFMAELDKKDAIQEYRIKELEKKVDKHNNLIERTYILERDESVMNERLTSVEKKLETLHS